MVGLASVPQTIVSKCDPESFAALTELEGIVPGPYVGRHKWVMLERLDRLSDFELRDVITRSYDLVAAKTKTLKSKRRHSNAVKRGS
jgi:predicted DNA-binding protein (MmcQ/YjbR family)